MENKSYATNFLNPVQCEINLCLAKIIESMKLDINLTKKKKKIYMLRMKYKSLSPTGSWQDLERLITNAHTCPGTFSTPAGKRVPH